MKKVVKVPVIMQMEALECGAACLAMVLAYYEKWIPLEKVRSDCGVSRDGSSAKNILKAARNYGLKAQGYRMEPVALREIELPAVIHWNFNHFVVLNGFRKNRAVISDPARGRVEIPLEEFDQAFTGIVLRFEKTMCFFPEGKPKSVWEFARKRLQGTLPSFIFIFATGLLTALVNVVYPAFSSIFMDSILSGRNTDRFLPFLIAFGSTIIFQFAVSVVESGYLLKLRAKLAVTANAMFMWHILRLPVEFFSQRFAGDIAARQENNEGIAETFIQKLTPVLLNILMLIIYLVIMLRYSVLLSLAGITATLLNIAVIRLVSDKRINMSRSLERDLGKLAGFTTAGIEMIESIKASGAENGYFERWAGYHAKLNNSSVDFSRTDTYFGAIPELLQQIANTIVLMLGVHLILDSKFTIGMLIAFQGFLGAFLSPVNQLAGVMQAFQEMRSRMERVEDVLDYEPDILLPEEKFDDTSIDDNDIYRKLSGSIEINNLSFGYNKLSQPLLENFSMSLKPGSRVAFVGGSGSGKSTLAKLVSGLYKPWSGEILFDGKPKKQIKREVFTGSVAVVDQDIVIFEDTIAANMSMWDISIPEAALVEAAKAAQIHKDIMQRDGGYVHIIKEGGSNFSGGQRQRLELARAFAQNPSILILDEATSALDPKTELDVMETIKARGMTCIIIAHRLSTIRDCDEIIVLDQGHVLERGTHNELIKSGGVYSRLISSD